LRGYHPLYNRLKAGMSGTLQVGAKIQWKWGPGVGDGTIQERFERRVQRTIKGAKVVKNGSAENPAFLIRQADGDEVLKLGSELSAAQ
jgi:hypothetical protein